MNTLKAMETFVRIANSGSLTQAADQLGLSRALVSKHLQQLEAHLGVRLFNRTTRQVSLTEIGSGYLEFCTRILGEIDEQERSLSQYQAQFRGTLKVHSPMGYGNLHLAPVVAAFMRKYPDISVNAVLSDISMTPVEMIEGGFDLSIQTGDVADMSLPVRRIGYARWMVCATPGYLERHGAPAIPADLARHNCLVHRKVTPDGVWAFGADGSERIKVSGRLATNSVLMLREAVLMGEGLALLPYYCVGGDLREGRLVEVLSDVPVMCRPIHVLFAYSRYTPGKVRAFVDFLMEHSRAIGGLTEAAPMRIVQQD